MFPKVLTYLLSSGLLYGGHTCNSSCNVVYTLRETRMLMWYWL